MNKIILLLLFPIFLHAQNKDCEYDIEEKSDSITLKVLPQKLVHERIFGNKNEYLFFGLLNDDGVPLLNVQQIQKSKDFIKTNCLNKSSKIIIQLLNGKIITLKSVNDEICSELHFDSNEKNNVRILNGFFYFTKSNYEELKNSPISIIRIQYVAESKDYVFTSQLTSETLKTTSKPSSYFIDYLYCIE